MNFYLTTITKSCHISIFFSHENPSYQYFHILHEKIYYIQYNEQSEHVASIAISQNLLC